jgi:hypothetical protein
MRPNWPILPSLFIDHQAPHARIPCLTTAIRHVTTAVPCTVVACVHRLSHACAPPSSTPPLVNMSPLPFDQVPPPPPDSTADHRPHPLATDTERIRVLRATDSARSRPIGDLRPKIPAGWRLWDAHGMNGWYIYNTVHVGNPSDSIIRVVRARSIPS